MATMQYLNFLAIIEYDPQIDSFHGRVINATPITFYGKSTEELKQEFARSVEDYFKFCQEKGVEPIRPYSGRFNLRLTPELHARVAAAAATSGKSLNQWIVEMLNSAVRQA